METYVRPLDAPHLSIEELHSDTGPDRLTSLRNQEAERPLLPRETVGVPTPAALRSNEASATPISATGNAATAGEVSTQAISLPEPSHSMTLQECILGLGTSQFYFTSRFAACSGAQFDQVWLVNGKPVGTSSFDVVVIGEIPQGSRTMMASYYFLDFTRTGNNNAPAMGITGKASIPQSWPSTASYETAGNLPGTRTWASIADGVTFKQTVTAPAGQAGNLGIHMITGIYQPSISLTAAPGWVMEPGAGGDIFWLPVRWDEADYLPGAATGGAAVFTYLGTLEYSTAADAPEREVALHIQQALNNPEQTTPVWSGKDLPGASSSEPLTRLYNDTKRRERNRSRALWNCVSSYGPAYTEGGTKQCDEYPFSSTYQGASQYEHDALADMRNFSSMPVRKEDNEAAGILLGQFYDKNRIIDGPDDGFIVKIS
ncbi:hypothetical protein [Streptomyces sp. NPDC090994]|uniref:NucA/NucB deoxyribonuclease domain-containing protein n=1 Tax=Streptomyces sp. NPDC090994 TaxID=3365969 RepID=UPI0038097A6C